MAELEIVMRRIEELEPADYNPRYMSEKDAEELEKSLRRFGFVDPVLVNMHPDRKNTIIGGHQRVKIASKIGFDRVPCVELELTLQQERELNIRLNKNVGNFDYDLLANGFDVDELLDWGFEESELFGEEEPEPTSASAYTKKVEIPLYEPNGEKPLLAELYTENKTDDLVAEIQKADIPDDVKRFLTYAAYRHTKFHFKNIAEYYSHAEPEIQRLMEQSALIIIDFDKAIQQGFLRVRDDILEQYLEEYGSED